MLSSFSFCSIKQVVCESPILGFRHSSVDRNAADRTGSTNCHLLLFFRALATAVCSSHEEGAVEMEKSLIFNHLSATGANMHLYFACYLQARRDAGRTGRYASPTTLRGPHSPSDRE
jgi:hypothetical protein